ncbi:MAG: hypothetical protein L0Z54_03700 [Thermoplasmata archaeon]|nr:hypothetical protein [Thermoplasmata archaeon]
MKVHVLMTLSIDPVEGEAIFRSVNVDNNGYVESRLDDRMSFSAKGSVGEVRNTVNDLLGCIGNAMGVVTELSDNEGAVDEP